MLHGSGCSQTKTGGMQGTPRFLCAEDVELALAGYSMANKKSHILLAEDGHIFLHVLKTFCGNSRPLPPIKTGRARHGMSRLETQNMVRQSLARHGGP